MPFTLQPMVAEVTAVFPKFFSVTDTVWFGPGVTGVVGATMALMPASVVPGVNSYAPGSGVVVLRTLPLISSVTAARAWPVLFTRFEFGCKLLAGFKKTGSTAIEFWSKAPEFTAFQSVRVVLSP